MKPKQNATVLLMLRIACLFLGVIFLIIFFPMLEQTRFWEGGEAYVALGFCVCSGVLVAFGLGVDVIIGKLFHGILDASKARRSLFRGVCAVIAISIFAGLLLGGQINILWNKERGTLIKLIGASILLLMEGFGIGPISLSFQKRQ
jgi:hypothetical protein